MINIQFNLPGAAAHADPMAKLSTPGAVLAVAYARRRICGPPAVSGAPHEVRHSALNVFNGLRGE
jgi:hypothetical protein